MNVSLVAYTPNPEVTVALAARTCYSHHLSLEISLEKAQILIQELIQRGHESVLEHASFTFQIEGISRVASHQLVRHRLASYSQQSHRYVALHEPNFVCPPSIAKHEEAHALYREVLGHCQKTYERLLQLGIEKEDARYLLPQGVTTNLFFSANARELLHIFRLRLCNRAQWEIRELCWQMLTLVRVVAPSIFALAGPPCVDGICPEGEKSCGRPWKKSA